MKLHIPLLSSSGSKAVNADCSRTHKFQQATVFRRWSLTYQQILCIIAGLLPLAVILLLSAAGDVVLFGEFISKLGVGQHALVFNSTLMVAPLLAIPFVFHVYKRYNYLIILFIATVLSLVGVGLFPSTSEFHKPLAALFFLLAFATMLVSSTRMTRRWSRRTTFTLGILGFVGTAFFNPFTETLLVFAVGLWVAGVGLFSSRLYEK